MTDVPRWRRGLDLLGLTVRDMDRTRDLKLTLEITQGVRPDDPARAILAEHARGLSDELQSMRSLREELRAAAQREHDEMESMMRRALPDE